MLLPADASLIERDRKLPGLATVLAPEAFLAALRLLFPEAEPKAAQPVYVRYKPGTSCLVGYQLEVGGERVFLYARAHRFDAQDKLRKAHQRASIPGPFGPGRIVLTQKASLISVFPNDSKLKALALLADEHGQKRLFRPFTPEPAGWRNTSVHTLRYKPERRYVCQLRFSDGASAVLKFYTAAGYQAASNNAAAFESRGPLRIARRIGHSARHCILAFEWLPGQLLSEALSDPDLKFERLATVGAALACLHNQIFTGLVPLAREAEASSLLALAEWLSFVCPHLARRANSLSRKLVTRLMQKLPVKRPTHGDFYAKQILLADDTVAILDLDEAVLADPAADVGLFIAHLERDALRGTLAPDRVEPISQMLIEGYCRAARDLLAGHIALYTAAALFRLAPDPFRHREPDWPERTEALLERAEQILDHGFSQSVFVSQSPISRPPSAVEVFDPFGVTGDERMPFLAQALNPDEVERQLAHNLAHLAGQLRALRVTRYKPGRRCLIEYDLETEASEMITLVGKVRARGLDEKTYCLLRSLWNDGFEASSADGISVPEPVGMIPAFNMWLQRKVSGVPATELLAKAGGRALMRRIAAAIHKLHQAGIAPHRRHTMADELRILRARLTLVAQMRPHWAARLERLLDRYEQLGGALPSPGLRGIHRDFYADQVLIAGERLYLIDLDLYCEGDPGLDVGNFLGHLTEQSWRSFGDPEALADRAGALEESFVALAGEERRAAVRTYAMLTLARHIYLSTQFPERRYLTEPLLELCEQRLSRVR